MDDGGKLVISLDLELFWGCRRQQRLEACRDELLSARRAVPRLLQLFRDYDLRATWPVVGLLFATSKDEMLEVMPDQLPVYRDIDASPYAHIARIGASERDDPVHFAPTLIGQIAACPGQEVASHTFSNFYCGQRGQQRRDFRADLGAAIDVARRRGIILRSLVVPFNDLPEKYLEICGQLGISAYRGVPPVWPYSRSESDGGNIQSGLRRWARRLDTVVPLTGTRCVQPPHRTASGPVNVAATRRLLPVLEGTDSWSSPLPRWRLVTELDHAAREGGIVHLWGRVADFAHHLTARCGQLRRILDRFAHWRTRDRMQSLTMHDVVMERDSESTTPRPRAVGR